MSLNTHETSERIEQIHPLNADFLLDTQPHRLYGDRGGNILEVLVDRFASKVVETLYGHGGIIALGYHDATSDGQRSFVNGYLLRRNGRIHAFHSYYGEIPLGIELDIFYMLLNPAEINNWILQDRKAVERERDDLGRFGLGMNISNRNPGELGLRGSLIQMKNRYLNSLK